MGLLDTPRDPFHVFIAKLKAKRAANKLAFNYDSLLERKRRSAFRNHDKTPDMANRRKGEPEIL